MTTREQEVIRQFRLLDEAGRRRVLRALAREKSAVFDAEDWFRRADELQVQFRAAHGAASVDVAGLLRETREGRD